MTEKEMKKLGRLEMLELLLEQTRKAEEYKKEADLLRKQLENRRLICQETGNIAEAALKLNHVFQAAQEAADQYLENIRILASQDQTEEEGYSDSTQQEFEGGDIESAVSKEENV